MEFRTNPQKKVFGNERKNAKCQKCEKPFNFDENQLDEDPLAKSWSAFNDKDMIMIKPSGKQEFFKRDKFETPAFKTADEVK